MAYEWKDKVVLITGAAAGIGALVVRKLVKFEKVKHVTIIDVNQEGAALAQALNEIFGDGKVAYFKCDITKDDELDAAFKWINDKFGHLDVLINNAGIMNDSYQVYKKMVDVNVTALFTCTLKALEIMRKDEGGRGGTIINTASIAALKQHPTAPMYCDTKSAVLQFTLCLSLDEYFSRTGVRIITICYGASGTSMLTKQKMGNFDKVIDNRMEELLSGLYLQKPETAANGLIDAYKHGDNGSTWLSTKDRPVKDITEEVTMAYKILTDLTL
ncbi:15-hydroxyprostaglandin dehydrogenase [NAD(+)]-like isoform X1 [Plodia interpunctella]|uniref:15-hydroxyprostaglandin dehydrogenase [NAD(+)]-like isoform X1 n=1 Tax=Plodia interpunctella TaxID=58824 RepID=UPI002368B868|nr:15-hydroxyprostaglandin dehydrogenase [NAD(+)]-like isoform X1 [Plodia interpunctella]